MGSRPQLGEVLFSDAIGFETEKRTKTGRIQVNQEVLESLDSPFVKRYLLLEKLKKLQSTSLKGILREVEGEYIHPFFSLHTVRSFRSSSDSPNFHNIPVRDPKMGKLIRSCFIARDGHQLVEIDYGAIEVRISACYHKDPTMLEYINDPTKDMHRDMAAEIFLCEPEEVTKQMRYVAKNGFVFPQFYGSYFGECAPNIWNAMNRMELDIDGTPLHGWLADKGIDGLGKKISHYTTGRIETEHGTFMEHIRGVEEDFWQERFPVYDKWKDEWWEAYREEGGFTTLTGFRIDGVMKRNDVINYPVQGSAFHCLLWSLIRLQRWLRKKKKRTKMVGQIHDSLVLDVAIEELEEVLRMAKKIMTEDIRKVWNWIIVPLEVEAEVSPVGGSWFDKKEVEI
jgi:DNA polymerase-1